MRKLHPTFALLCIFFCAHVFALGSPNSNSQFHIEYWHDPETAEVLDSAQATFTPVEKGYLDLGLARGYVWLKLSYELDTTEELAHYLTLEKVHFQHIKLLEYKNDQLTRSIDTGTNFPFASRDVKVPHWVFNLPTDPGRHEILLRLRTNSVVQSGIKVQSAAEVVETSSQYLIYNSIIIGLFVLLCVTAIALAYTLKQRVIWLGLMLAVSVLAEIISSSGLGFTYLWPELPELNRIVARIALGSAIGFTGLFAVDFLKVSAYRPRLARVTQWASILLIIGMIPPLPAVSPVATVLLASLAPICVILCTTAAFQNKMPGARLIVVGFGTFISAVIVTGLASLNVLPKFYGLSLMLDTSLVIMTLVLVYAMMLRIGQQALNNAVTTESIKAKSMFFATMSHEIRTPINGILGMLNLLLKENLNEPQNRLTCYARSSAESLLTIINDILDFSKIEAGKLDLEVIEFDVVSLLEEIVDSFACLESNANLEIVLNTSAIRKETIISDPGRLRQILNNLLSNACKFTESGEVEVVASLEEMNQTSQLKVTVRDTGIGITAEQLPILFNLFTQADGSTTRKYGGTGLGLAIAKNLCELMNGGIEATSRPGAGSKFSFHIEVEVAEVPQKEKPDLHGKNALVYDPNAISLKAAQSYLNAWQATVKTVKSREEFFTELDKLKPEIAICCDDIKETGHHPEFFICTADSSVAPAWTETISKPVTANKLKRVLLGKPAQRGTNDKQQDSTDLDQKQPYRLLLVEDNFINTEVALGILEDHGFDDVAHAENGQEAIECLRQGKYDLVLMDCQMPIVDGYEATKQIREGAAGSQSDIPVIAMTANAMAGDREKCLAFGMNDYISKPIDPDKLAGTIQQWL